MPPRKKKYSYNLYNEFNSKISIHTSITYIAAVLAILIQGYLGFRHIGDTDPVSRRFGFLCLIEAFMCGIGLLLVDIIRGHSLFPKPFREIHPSLFQRTVFIFIVIAIIQYIFFFIPLTIRNWEMALAVVFASVSEEIFFRAFLLGIFINLGRGDKLKISLGKKRKISPTEIFGILFTGFLFVAFHINYYSNITLMLVVLCGGIWLGFIYWWWKDLTAVIAGHFLLNIIYVVQSGWLVNLMG